MTQDLALQRLDEQYQKADAEGERGHALGSLELLGRHLGLFTDRLEIIERVQKMSDAELMAEVRRIIAEEDANCAA